MANANEDYISIEYKHEKESDESNKEYYIEEYINGQYKERTIEIKRENDEVSLELTENSNYYELTKEISDIITYKLEYEIDGVEGEGTITEVILNDEVFYRYHIEEDGEEEEFEFEDDDDEDEEDEDNEDEEDLEDEEDEEDLEDEEDQEETETEDEEETETEDDEEDLEDEEEIETEESEDE
jgi:HIV Tat-specific factor 1